MKTARLAGFGRPSAPLNMTQMQLREASAKKSASW